MNESQLKQKLQALAANKFQLSENDDLSQLLEAMLAHIGSTDNYLRDDLIYYTFAAWMLDLKLISPSASHEILQRLLGAQHIFYHIGERDTDSIFKRSFSVLLLPLFLMAHRAQPFLSNDEVIDIKQKMLQYLKEEKDHRGFVDEKGWAHSTAHSADVLAGLAECSELTKADLHEILAVIRDTVSTFDDVYALGEDERLVSAAMTVIKRTLLSEAEITQWIDGFAAPALASDVMPQAIMIRANIKNFLQSLYFRMDWELTTQRFSIPINQTLRKISLFAS